MKNIREILMRTITLAILFSVLMVVPSYAVTGNTWLKNCNDKDSDLGQGLCLGYFSGLRDMERLINNFELSGKVNGKKYPVPKICMPKGVTSDQLRKVLIKWLNDHPENLHEPLDLRYLQVMRETFPCMKAKLHDC